VASAAGVEIAAYRIELELILARIMVEHSKTVPRRRYAVCVGARCIGRDRVRDLERAMERCHVRKAWLKGGALRLGSSSNTSPLGRSRACRQGMRCGFQRLSCGSPPTSEGLSTGAPIGRPGACRNSEGPPAP
jgi:hypothetical protein